MTIIEECTITVLGRACPATAAWLTAELGQTFRSVIAHWDAADDSLRDAIRRWQLGQSSQPTPDAIASDYNRLIAEIGELIS